MQVAILGELTVSQAGRPVEVSGSRLRLLLLRLAAESGRPVSPALLGEAIWDGSAPADPVNALQTLVSRLRRALGSPDYVQQLPSGYRLTGAELDTDRCTELAAAGRRAAASGDYAGAAGQFGQALQLWRGTPLADAAGAEWAAILSDHWAELLLDLTADRIEAKLNAAGNLGTDHAASDHLGELNLLVSRYPLRERFAGLLMSALSAAGRTAEALTCYERLRAQLADELGTDPDPALQQQHLQLLRATAEQSSADSTPPNRQRRSNLRSALTSFIGRQDEIGRVSSLLESGRLATVLGPGGAGKTRLAGVVAAAWTDRSPDGVWFVELAPVTEESELPQAILDSLGIR